MVVMLGMLSAASPGDTDPVPECCDPDDYQPVFSGRFARRQTKRYQRRGLTPAAQGIADFVASRGIEHATVLEIGGGVGQLQVELRSRRSGCRARIDARDHGHRSGSDDAPPRCQHGRDAVVGGRFTVGGAADGAPAKADGAPANRPLFTPDVLAHGDAPTWTTTCRADPVVDRIRLMGDPPALTVFLGAPVPSRQCRTVSGSLPRPV
jgi:hypothetical protein